MFLKKIISGITIFIFAHGIQNLEILENLDLLEEDIDLLETMTEIGDEDES